MYKKSFKEFLNEQLKDPAFKKHYDDLEPEFALISLMIEKRMKKKITQTELAKRMGTKQSAIARFESGNYNPSLKFAYRLADALGVRMKITFEAKAK